MSTPRRFSLWPAPPLVLALLALLACSQGGSRFTPLPPRPTPAASPTERVPGPTHAAATAVPGGPTAAGSPAPGALSASGPWLVFSAHDGIWAANADGSGETLLMRAATYFRLGPAAPTGGHVTVVTGSDNTATAFHGLTLWLLSLPGGQLTKIAALTNAQTEPGPNVQSGDAALDITTPLGQAAWSPDGADLAFIGAQAGPSADLYRYHLASGQITRLTDDPSQAYSPSWSPDGRYILQMGAPSFSTGNGNGHPVDGVWAAAADNSGVKLLYQPDSGEESLLGWLGPETFEVASLVGNCSNAKVRAVNIADGKVQTVFSNSYALIALDPASGTTLLMVDEFAADCQGGGPQQGLFLARPGVAPRLLDASAGEGSPLGWSAEGGLFYAGIGAGWQTFTPEGKAGPTPDGINGAPVIAAGGRDWAWADEASYLLSVSLGGGPAFQVSVDPVLFPTWSPDGKTLLFFSDDALWAGNPRLGQPVKTRATINQIRTDVVEWAR